MAKNYAVILAGGSGERLEWHVPKQYMKIAGKTLLEHTIERFEGNARIDEIIIVTNPQFVSLTEELVLKNEFGKVRRILNGGRTRRASSTIGVNSIAEDEGKVLVHDAVMPFVTDQIIDECLAKLDACNAVDVAIPTVDTIIQIDDDLRVANIPDRKYVMRGLTPQGFKVGTIKQAHAYADRDDNTTATDDCGLILQYGLGPVRVVKGDVNSLKVTYPEDVYLAEKLFQIKGHQPPNRIELRRLQDRVVVVFGGGRGIGKCMVDTARRHGAKAHGFSRRSGVDVRKPEDIARALAEVAEKEGRIDHVAATAAVLYSGKLEARAAEEIIEEIEINLLGSIHVIRASHPHLARSRGSIVLFAGTSYTRGRPLYATYTSTKAAIVNLMQGVAEEFQRDAVRINAMNPERIAGEMRRENFGEEAEDTLLEPEVVAEAALRTLISNWSGQIVDVKKN